MRLRRACVDAFCLCVCLCFLCFLLVWFFWAIVLFLHLAVDLSVWVLLR